MTTGDTPRAIRTTVVEIRCAGCNRILGQTYRYIKASEMVTPSRLAGPFCDDCANRRRAR